MINKAIPAGERYAAIHESLRKDYRLTALDWRVMVYLLNRSENWKVSQADIANEVLSDERAIRKSLIHLETLEYGHRVMRQGAKQTYMVDFVLNYTSPSIPTNRNHSAGSTGTTVPDQSISTGTTVPDEVVSTGTTVPVQPELESAQPELEGREPEPQCRFNRNASTASTGTTVPTTEQEQNSRQNKNYGTVVTETKTKPTPLHQEDSEAGADAYGDMLTAILDPILKGVEPAKPIKPLYRFQPAPKETQP